MHWEFELQLPHIVLDGFAPNDVASHSVIDVYCRTEDLENPRLQDVVDGLVRLHGNVSRTRELQ